MNAKHINDIIRDLKEDLHKAQRKARALSPADDAQLYYAGVIRTLKFAIGKYEQIYNGTVPKTAKKRRG